MTLDPDYLRRTTRRVMKDEKEKPEHPETPPDDVPRGPKPRPEDEPKPADGEPTGPGKGGG